MASIVKTEAAFAAYRVKYPNANGPDLSRVANDDEMVPVPPEDGLQTLQDGCDPSATAAPPSISNNAAMYLWVVRQTDVVYAAERCAFGTNLATRALKHTNLTGGEPAHAGGEMFIVEPSTIVITGKSGRYPITDAAEMRAIETAFKDSGYVVWSIRYDEEAACPYPFAGSTPKLVA